MRDLVVVFALLFILCAPSVGCAQSLAQRAPGVVNARTSSFASPPNLPDLSAAWAIGGEKRSEPYLLLVKLKERGQIPPHHHPDPRIVTVVSGKLSIGFGEGVTNGASTVASAGDSFVVPANTPHYVMAVDGHAEYQECGHGPTGTVFSSRR